MRDEDDLIMKRLRIPWRERAGSQVNERKKKMVSQEEMEVRKEKVRSQERLKKWEDI